MLKIRHVYISGRCEGKYWPEESGDGPFGVVYHATKREIWIDRGLPFYRKPGTLIHELIHFVIDILGGKRKAHAVFHAIGFNYPFHGLSWFAHCFKHWQAGYRYYKRIRAKKRWTRILKKGGDKNEN